MSCNNCEETNPCNPCIETIVDCACPVKDLSTDCIVYTGDYLPCSGIPKGTILTQTIQMLDAFVCNKFDTVVDYLSLTNVGAGAQVYKGISGIGTKEIRTITSSDSSVTVTQNADEIDITTTHTALKDYDITLSTNTLTLLEDSVPKTNIDLSPYIDDTNLPRLVSGAVVGTDLILTRDDATTFTTDVTSLTGGGSSIVQQTKVTLSAAQILALFTTPVELIPAPGVGKVLNILDISARVNFNTVAFDASESMITNFFSGAPAETFVLVNTAINNVATTLYSGNKLSPGGNGVVYENNSYSAAFTTTNPTVGDGSIDVYVTYETITL